MKQRRFFILLILVAIMVFPKVECSAADSSYWSDDGIRATSFSNTSGTTITIMNAAELGLLAYDVNNSVSTYSGYTIELNCDIDLSAHKWKAIGGTTTTSFEGTFDGKHYKINNVYLYDTTTGQGLFGYISSTSIIRNLYISTYFNISSTTTQFIGGVVGYNKGYINNCRVILMTMISGGKYVGGIAGRNTGYINNCYSTGIIMAYNYAGMLIGMGGTVNNCYWSGTTTTQVSGSTNTWYGAAATTFTNVYSGSSTLSNTAEFTVGTTTIPISGDLVIALNAWVTTNGSSTYSSWCYDSGNAVFEDTYNVAIGWGDVTGVYTQTYNPETRTNTYEWQHYTTTITIYNTSNVGIRADLSYTPNAYGAGTTCLFFNPGTQSYVSYMDVRKNNWNEFYTELSGTPTNYTSWDNTEIGTITISISKSEG